MMMTTFGCEVAAVAGFVPMTSEGTMSISAANRILIPEVSACALNQVGQRTPAAPASVPGRSYTLRPKAAQAGVKESVDRNPVGRPADNHRGERHRHGAPRQGRIRREAEAQSHEASGSPEVARLPKG